MVAGVVLAEEASLVYAQVIDPLVELDGGRGGTVAGHHALLGRVGLYGNVVRMPYLGGGRCRFHGNWCCKSPGKLYRLRWL